MVGMKKKGAHLEVKDVTLRFGGIQALRSVSFEASPSQLIALVGPNGAGKTAMLNCVNGIYHPREGQIFLDGEKIAKEPLWHMVERRRRPSISARRIVCASHRDGKPSHRPPSLIPRRCIAERYLFRACAKEEMDARREIEAVIDFFELYRHRNTPVGALPYGVQKIVGVARAMASEPRLLLLDEPCTGLIREERENLARFILRIMHDLGPTIVWVEHDMQMVSDLADRVVVLNYGAKIADGPPHEVTAQSEVLAAYLGGPDALGASRL